MHELSNGRSLGLSIPHVVMVASPYRGLCNRSKVSRDHASSEKGTGPQLFFKILDRCKEDRLQTALRSPRNVLTVVIDKKRLSGIHAEGRADVVEYRWVPLALV